MKRREAWFEEQLDLDPERLVFIDETWASTSMARTRGRCRRGERLRVGVPHGHWKTTTFIAGLTTRGMTVREIQGHLLELYGLEVSPDLISTVTDAVLER